MFGQPLELIELTQEQENVMADTIKRMTAQLKGILAADESTGTIGKRFANINVENTHENRYRYRDLVFKTPNLRDHISGVITYDETLYDVDENGTRLVQPLLDNDIVVGIKTDRGLADIIFSGGIKYTKGLDDLEERSRKAYEAGARFAKWRCVIDIDPVNNFHSQDAIYTNAVILAQYARISQSCGLVPIVEPEVLMNKCGDIKLSESVTRQVLSEVYRQLVKFGVRLDLTLLKPNMVRAGTVPSYTTEQLQEIAVRTLSVLADTVPPSVPGVVFLSGGMTESDATEALKWINQYAYRKAPWRLSFSYGRALQQSALQAWNGSDANVAQAQQVLYQKAQENGVASTVQSVVRTV